MEQYIVLGAFIVIPILLTLLLRTNAALLFFVIAGAYLLKSYIDQDITELAGSFIPGNGPAFATAAILVVPLIIVAFAFKGTVQKRALPLHIITAVLAGGTLIFVSQAFMTPGLVGSIEGYQLWPTIKPYSGLIIASAFLMSVLVLWFATPKHGGKKHHK